MDKEIDTPRKTNIILTRLIQQKSFLSFRTGEEETQEINIDAPEKIEADADDEEDEINNPDNDWDTDLEVEGKYSKGI